MFAQALQRGAENSIRMEIVYGEGIAERQRHRRRRRRRLTRSPPPPFSHSIWKRVRYEIHHNQHYQHHVRNFFSCETTAGEEMEKYVYNLL